MSSCKCHKLTHRQALLLKGLLELVCREVLCWESACCISLHSIYSACIVAMRVSVDAPGTGVMLLTAVRGQCVADIDPKGPGYQETIDKGICILKVLAGVYGGLFFAYVTQSFAA